MGLIREPLEVDFYVDPTPLTKEEEKLISDFIKAEKSKRRTSIIRLKSTKHLAKQEV